VQSVATNIRFTFC